MRDQQHGHRWPRGAEAGDERGLAGDVDCGGGLVEQQQRRRTQQRAGDHQPLALAARQPRAANREGEVETGGFAADEVAEADEVERLPESGVVAIAERGAEIMFDRAFLLADIG